MARPNRSQSITESAVAPVTSAQLELPILSALIERGGMARRKDLFADIAQVMSFSQTDLKRAGKVTAWQTKAIKARARLIKQGDMLASARSGWWEISRQGRARYRNSLPDPEAEHDAKKTDEPKTNHSSELADTSGPTKDGGTRAAEPLESFHHAYDPAAKPSTDIWSESPESHPPEVEQLAKQLIDRGQTRGFLTTNEIAQHLIEAGVAAELLSPVLSLLRQEDLTILDDEISESDAEGPQSVSHSMNHQLGAMNMTHLPKLDAQQTVERFVKREQGKQAEQRLEQEAELSRSERVRLQRQVREGREAQAQLVEANVPMVILMARRYQDLGVATSDLIQEGNLGLMRAVEGFDYRLGWRFSTYAFPWIRNYLVRALATQSRTIRLPHKIREQMQVYRKFGQDFRREYGRDPSVEEIAWHLEQPLTEVTEIIQGSQGVLSLDSPVDEEGEATLGDFVSDRREKIDPVARTINTQLAEKLTKALDVLTEREREVLVRRFGLADHSPKPLDEVAAEFKVSRERVRQLEIKALRKLRAQRHSVDLEVFLDSY